MKKILIIIVVVLVIPTVIYFLIKVSSKDILNKMLGDTNVKTEETTPIKNDKLTNKKVPFFDLPTIDGDRIKLSSFTDKPFIVVFFVTWNVQSINQLKILDEYINSNRKEDKIVNVIAINSQEEMSVVKSFMRRGGYGVQVAVDIKGDIGENFNIKSFPTSFFVDRDGIVREVYSGVLNKVMLVDKIEQLLN